MHPLKIQKETEKFGRKYMELIQLLVQEGEFRKAFNLADQFEKLFIDVLIFSTKDQKEENFVTKSLELMMEFERQPQEPQNQDKDNFSYKTEFEDDKESTRPIRKLLDFTIECKNNKAVIYFLT